MSQEASLGIVFDESETKIILVKRKDVPIWVLPGGGIDPGELPESAARREIYEETGVEVEILYQSGEYLPINRLTQKASVFVCKAKTDALNLSEETSDISFFSLESLPDNFFHIHSDWVKDAIDSPNTLHQKPIDQVTYLNLIRYFFKHPMIVFRFGITQIKNWNR